MNSKSMYKVLIFSFLFLSCGYRTVKLLNGRTKVPQTDAVFLTPMRNNKYLKGDIDTLSLYREINSGDSIRQSAYRFYGNGALNLFCFLIDHIDSENAYDPAFNGYRGYYYESSGSLKADLFLKVSAGGMDDMGLETETFQIKGDTLMVSAKNITDYYLYVKRPMPKNIAKYKATW